MVEVEKTVDVGNQSSSENPLPRQSLRARAGAAGKALLVYLGSGSVLLALVAYLAFSGMGC